MREIKFRVWNPKDKVMDYAANELNIRCTNVVAEVKDGKVAAEYMLVGGVWQAAEIMQYTGLKDKNGKEIYEGDVWNNGYRNFTVEFDEDAAGYFPFVTDDSCGCCSDETRKNSTLGEVIGNIHNNTELLEVSQ